VTLVYDGERFVPGIGGVIEAEHLHRYLLARVLAPGLDVLDVASGEGYGSNLLAQVARSVVGVDVADSAVAHARDTYVRPNLRFVQGDCARLPMADASVDLVVSFETIEHHDQHEAMLREIKRVLRPDGVLLISSPNRPEYDRTLSEPNVHHVKELDFAEFAGLLGEHFKQTAFYAQRFLSGSLIVPLQRREAGFFGFSDGAAGAASDDLARPIYFLALAGEGTLPGLGTSIFEAAAEASGHLSAPYLEARVYIAEQVNGRTRPYGEARGAAEVYALDGQRKHLRLVLPNDLHALRRLRLDIANAPSVIHLHALSLHQADSTKVWQWDGDGGAFVHPGGVFCLTQRNSALLLCLNDDPQFDLAIPPDVLDALRGSAYLQIELTPRPLTDALPDVLAELQTQRGGAVSTLTAAALPVGMADHLADLGQLLKTQMERKNMVIRELRAELMETQSRQSRLYEQLVRAEGQLELLKEFVLQGVGSRLERI
jgi:SAM-dependent methyltransferase